MKHMSKWLSVVLAIVFVVQGMTVGHAKVQGVTEDTIKIGLLAPFSGPSSPYGKISEGVEAMYRLVNDEEGGVHGRRFEFVVEDSACSPTQAIAAIRKMIYQDQVFMIHGGNCSNAVIAALPVIEEAGIPYVVQAAASFRITTPFRRNVFSPYTNSIYDGYTLVNFAANIPGEGGIAIIRQTDEWGQTFYEPVKERLQQLAITPVADVVLEPGATRATAQVLQLQRSGARAVIALLYAQPLATFMRDAYQLGLEVPVLATTAISIEDQVQRVGIPGASDQLFVVYAMKDVLGSPAMQEIADIITRYFPRHTVESVSFYGAGGARAVVEAFKRAGRDLTWDSFIQALESLEDFETGVYASPISFSSTERVGLRNLGIVTMVDGKARMIGSRPEEWLAFWANR